MLYFLGMMPIINKAERLLQKWKWLIILLLIAGVGARFVVMLRGYNFDLESWRLVADIMSHGGNVYAETYRYNYGPIWFEILHVLNWFAQLFHNPELMFRVLMVSVLTAADIGIWYLLKRKFGLIAGFLFFLNPLSIIITGYHNQFDTLAIFCAMAAITVYGDTKGGFSRRKLAGLALLGCALSIKHIFFLFPLWLAVRETGLWQKVVSMVLPIGIFLGMFLPFVADGFGGIAQNVFGYVSFNNAPFWFMAVPQVLQSILSAKVLFFGALILFAFIMRKRPLMESLLVYTLVLLVFSPSIANQYVAIASAAIAVFPNIFFGLYVLLTVIVLAMSDAGLHLNALKQLLPGPFAHSLSTEEAAHRAYDLPILMMSIGLLWHFQRKRVVDASKKCVAWVKREAQRQWKLFKAS